jgi:hypothetical protein
MRHGTATFAAFALILMGVGQARGDNLVVNGGFETGNFSGWTQSGSFSAVTGGPGHVGMYLGGYGPHSGDYYAALGTVRTLGTLSQTLTTTPGQTYTLSFFLANDGGTPNEFRVDWNGTTLLDQSGIGNQGYGVHAFVVKATSATTTLTFFERNDPGYLSLDDVTVSTGSVDGGPPPKAPEPSSFVLVGVGTLGLAGFAGIRLRRKASAAVA